jgi:alpha-L-rhamnosidase
MNSFNHYAYGAIGEWMYTVMAGIAIDPAAPGYKHIFIQPRPGGGFTRVSASHATPYGRLSSAWSIDAQAFELAVEVPANTSATIRMPGARLAGVTEGGQALASAPGLTSPRQDGPDVVVEAGSGQYRFSYAIVK